MYALIDGNNGSAAWALARAAALAIGLLVGVAPVLAQPDMADVGVINSARAEIPADAGPRSPGPTDPNGPAG